MVRTKIPENISDQDKKLLKEKGSLEGRYPWGGGCVYTCVCVCV